MTLTKSSTVYYASSASATFHSYGTITLPNTSLLIIRGTCRGDTATPGYLRYSLKPSGYSIASSFEQVPSTQNTLSSFYMRAGFYYLTNVSAGTYSISSTTDILSSMVYFITYFTEGEAVVKDMIGNSLSYYYDTAAAFTIPVVPVSPGGYALDFWSTHKDRTWTNYRITQVQEYNEIVGSGTNTIRAGCSYDLTAPDNDMGWDVVGGAFSELGATISVEEKVENNNNFFGFF